MRFFFTGYLADNRMVLSRTALEKISKNYLILLFTENNNKPNITIIEVANKLAKVCETLERMGSQQAVSKTVNDSIYKWLVGLERQCWRNAQYSRHGCIEIIGVTHNTQKEKICNLFTCYLTCFLCHRNYHQSWVSIILPSLALLGNNKIISSPGEKMRYQFYETKTFWSS